MKTRRFNRIFEMSDFLKLAEKWRRRAWLFRDAYSNARSEVFGLRLQVMQLQAYGSEETMRQQVASLQKKMLELAQERNELADKLRHLEGKARCNWCGEVSKTAEWVKYAVVCPLCAEKGRK